MIDKKTLIILTSTFLWVSLLAGCAKVADPDSICKSGGECCGIARGADDLNPSKPKINIYQCTKTPQDCNALKSNDKDIVVYPVNAKDVRHEGQCGMEKKTSTCFFPFCDD